jgi:hypothetical protein
MRASRGVRTAGGGARERSRAGKRSPKRSRTARHTEARLHGRKRATVARPPKPAAKAAPKPAGKANPPLEPALHRFCKPGWAVLVERQPSQQGTRFVCPFCSQSHRVSGPVRGFRKVRRAQWVKLRRVDE